MNIRVKLLGIRPHIQLSGNYLSTYNYLYYWQFLFLFIAEELKRINELKVWEWTEL